jgi:hypothetical protein
MTALTVENVIASVEGIQEKLGWQWHVWSYGTDVTAHCRHGHGYYALTVNMAFETDEEGRVFLTVKRSEAAWLDYREMTEDYRQGMDLALVEAENAISSGLCHLDTWR